MNKYWADIRFDSKKGRPYCLIYKRGEPTHFAIFYDEQMAKDYVEKLNMGL